MSDDLSGDMLAPSWPNLVILLWSLLIQASSETVAKWEEGKRWQKQTDRLKARLKEKEVELERLNKSNEMLKNALER